MGTLSDEKPKWRKEGGHGICWACDAERDLAFGLYEGDSDVLIGWVCDGHSGETVLGDVNHRASLLRNLAKGLDRFADAIMATQDSWPGE